MKQKFTFLIEEILSIIDKTKIDLEFIIVDDNSPDGTGQIAEELAENIPLKLFIVPVNWVWAARYVKALNCPSAKFWE